jgi:hypothetical protein
MINFNMCQNIFDYTTTLKHTFTSSEMILLTIENDDSDNNSNFAEVVS